MSSNYDVELAFNLREDVPSEAVSAIAFLTGDLKDAPDRPNHPYFTDYTWRAGALTVYLGGQLVRGPALCVFSRVYRYGRAGEEHYQHTFHLRCSCKLEPLFENLFLFLQWAALYCDGRQFVGYYLSESDCQPTLIYVSGGKVYMRQVREPPNSVIDGSAWPEAPNQREKRFAGRRARKPWWRLWK